MAIRHSVTTEGRWMVSGSGSKDIGKNFCKTSHITSGKSLVIQTTMPLRHFY